MWNIYIKWWLWSEDIEKLKTQWNKIIIDENNPLKSYIEHITNDFWLTKNTQYSEIYPKTNKQEEKTKLELISSVYTDTIMYMVYWYIRLERKPQEQKSIKESLKNYLWIDEKYINIIINDIPFREKSIEYVENKMASKPTIDIVLLRENNWKKEIWVIERKRYPLWLALPGGFIHDEDESNELNIPAHIYATLRVWWEKILNEENPTFWIEKDENDKEYYFVSNSDQSKKLKLYKKDIKWYKYKDHLDRIIIPSDPRHLVDTIWFEMYYEWEELKTLNWESRETIMNSENKKWWFIFNHHREIVAHLSSRTNLEKERDFNHSERVRKIINDPLAVYEDIKRRFEENGNNPDTSMPELFPVVDKIKQSLFTDRINWLCKNNPTLLAVRDNVDNWLTHVSFKNRIFCPYQSTIRAIYEWIKFYDIIARIEKWFYEECKTDEPIQHNPQELPNALYHTYRYEYRYNEILSMIPNEILIPTFEYLGATDIMKIRGIPLRFIWLADEFIYVDEFEQSPKEFFMHDVNHSYRMAIEDINFSKKLWITRDQLFQESNKFLSQYLEKIKILKSDSKEEKEIKKLKKIILFEIIHEDARPATTKIIWEYIQQIEWNSVPFEVPATKEDWYREVTDLMDTGISTLSYVRNKLQHGFYDEVDSQMPQIVDPEYRYAKRIWKAAYEMLIELWVKPSNEAELDKKGNVSLERLMYRICAVGPDNIHNAKYNDPDMEKYWDWAKLLNPKRYQVD